MKSAPRPCAALALLLVSAAADVEADSADTQSIHVLFTNQSAATEGDLAGLEAITREQFRKGRISVTWTRCFDAARRVSPNHECEGTSGPTVFHVTLVNAAPRVNPHVLAMTTIGTGRATVFYEPVRALAETAEDVSVGQLLGRAAAHEIVHLILGPDHTADGVMKEAWSAHDLRALRQGHLWIHPAELQQVRAAISALTRR